MPELEDLKNEKEKLFFKFTKSRNKDKAKKPYRRSEETQRLNDQLFRINLQIEELTK